MKKVLLLLSFSLVILLSCQDQSGGLGISSKYYSLPEEKGYIVEFNTEEYDRIVENAFLSPLHQPLSTFSIDVDAASYSNVRRFLNNDMLPPKDAVRTEELINYFDYDYPQPEDADPFSITTEMATCPWNTEHKLLMVGLQGKKVETQQLPPTNLVFLLDVSGSMGSYDKLPLLKKSFRLLTEQLRPEDRVAIVVYAGASGLVLPSTPGENKKDILKALEKLEAGGSTAGAAGIELAYKVAADNFIENGNNRVILATDGDFNVGQSSDAELERLIEQKREKGIFLSVLGFGTGNLKDNKMEMLADKGNGNYAYIDNLLEAKKVLVTEMGGTLFTIAKDVKIQIEFNPANVQAYRLIGYENRLLNKEDFNDDKKDAGELGAGHTVTALYEIIPQGVDWKENNVDTLKYQKTRPTAAASTSDEWLTVKLRYKKPAGDTSQLLSQTFRGPGTTDTSANLRWAATVVEFAMLLRDSEYKGSSNYKQVLASARKYLGSDENGYRTEFIQLLRKAELLSDNVRAEETADE